MPNFWGGLLQKRFPSFVFSLAKCDQMGPTASADASAGIDFVNCINLEEMNIWCSVVEESIISQW